MLQKIFCNKALLKSSFQSVMKLSAVAMFGKGTKNHGPKVQKIKKKVYNVELERLQDELVKLQQWVVAKGLKVVVIFEGRDAAGKGGVIKRITQHLKPTICRVAALPAPTERQTTQFYYQRYISYLPAAGEIVLYDRSWYNRGGVEKVMGFCTDLQHEEWLRSTPVFERMLIQQDTILVKYWFSVTQEEQYKRFMSRATTKNKMWKLSPMDMESLDKWDDYSEAKDIMFAYTDTKDAPWTVVHSTIKKHAHLNCINHLLQQVDYEDLTPEKIDLPAFQIGGKNHLKGPFKEQHFADEYHLQFLGKQ